MSFILFLLGKSVISQYGTKPPPLAENHSSALVLKTDENFYFIFLLYSAMLFSNAS